jgi:hypothetical protein
LECATPSATPASAGDHKDLLLLLLLLLLLPIDEDKLLEFAERVRELS